MIICEFTLEVNYPLLVINNIVLRCAVIRQGARTAAENIYMKKNIYTYIHYEVYCMKHFEIFLSRERLYFTTVLVKCFYINVKTLIYMLHKFTTFLLFLLYSTLTIEYSN